MFSTRWHMVKVFAWKHRKYFQHKWKRHVIYFALILLYVWLTAFLTKEMLKQLAKTRSKTNRANSDNEIDELYADLNRRACKTNYYAFNVTIHITIIRRRTPFPRYRFDVALLASPNDRMRNIRRTLRSRRNDYEKFSYRIRAAVHNSSK